MSSITGERKYQTYAGWRRAAKEAGATHFEGDKDIAHAWNRDGFAVGEWDGAEGSIYVRGGARRNPPSRDDLYVEFLRPMPNEEPFVLDGTKYEFVLARYSDGREDLGVYSHAGDLTYGYEAFNRMMNLPRPQSTDPRILEMRQRLGTGRSSRRNPISIEDYEP